MEILIILSVALETILLAMLYAPGLDHEILLAMRYGFIPASAVSGYLVGLEFPLAGFLFFRSGEGVMKTAETLYAADLCGAFIGSLLVGVILAPALGILQTYLAPDFLFAFHYIINYNHIMKYNELASAIKGPIFSRNDLIFSGYKVFDYQLSLWVKKGYLIQLKRGVYAFNRDKEKIRGEAIAFLLYQPSYLSLESALSWYGFIPEIVHAFTSVTARTTRSFENACGRFIYRHVKADLFWGYIEMKTEDHAPYLLAEPEKALLDYLYLNISRINNRADFENIRLNEEQMEKTLDKGKFLKYMQVFNMKKMEKWARLCLP